MFSSFFAFCAVIKYAQIQLLFFSPEALALLLGRHIQFIVIALPTSRSIYCSWVIRRWEPASHPGFRPVLLFVYYAARQRMCVLGQSWNTDLTRASGTGDRWPWPGLPDENRVCKRYAIWWTSRGWDCDDVRPCYVKKKYPAAALAACRELIKEAEGACLGLRVTLNTSRETGIGLKRGKKRKKQGLFCGLVLRSAGCA